MFESVLPQAFHKRRNWLLYKVLPLSIAIHGIGIAAILIGTVWNVVFPVESPRLVRAYSLASIPDPPPPPAAPAPPAPKTPAPQQLPTRMDTFAAPTVIPDLIPRIPDPAPAAESLPSPTNTAAAGVPGGEIDGLAGGLIGGTGHGPAGAIPFPDDGRVHIERNQQLPLQVVSQEFPSYPDEAKRRQLEDQVVVRYIIGKKGKVIEVEILRHASFAAFDSATVDAIREWRFRPMIRDGKPVEVVHDLAVNYVLVRR